MQGLVLGYVTQEIFSLTVLLIVITITVTTYLIKYDNFLYHKLSKHLGFFEKLIILNQHIEKKEEHASKEIVIFSGHRTGRVLVELFKNLKKEFLVVDFNPDIIKTMSNKGISCLYGDVSNKDVLNEIDFKKTKMVVSTIPVKEDNLMIINHLKQVNPKAIVFVTTAHLHETKELYKAGADYVILPYVLTGEMLADMVERILVKKEDINKIKKLHLLKLDQANLWDYQLTRR